jgi:hypothetical protein
MQVPESVIEPTRQLAHVFPYWGYGRVAVIACREGLRIGNKRVYQIFESNNLLHRPKPHEAALFQAPKLFELLPSAVNRLWQMDVTYLNIPGHGWWYAVTVIDDYSRYLLALHFTASYRSADVTTALELARVEAERVHGPLAVQPTLVPEDGGDPVTPADVYVCGITPTLPRWQRWARNAKRTLENALHATIQDAPAMA